MLQQIVRFIFPPQCGGCAKIGTGACDRCLPRATLQLGLPTLNVTALGPYEHGLRRAVLALKSGRRDVAEAFSSRIAEVLWTGEVLVPVPTTPGRRRERGFDGCELIALQAARQSTASTLRGLVQTAGDRQRGRNRDARLSARGRFAWRGGFISGMHVTLLDDVVTTGATLEDCASVLRSQGAVVDRAIVVAKA